MGFLGVWGPLGVSQCVEVTVKSQGYFAQYLKPYFKVVKFRNVRGVRARRAERMERAASGIAGVSPVGRCHWHSEMSEHSCHPSELWIMFLQK